MGNFADFIDLVRTVSANRKVRKAQGESTKWRFHGPSSDTRDFLKTLVATFLALTTLGAVALALADDTSFWIRILSLAIAWSAGMGCGALFDSLPYTPTSRRGYEDHQGFPDRD